jgi:hypothetical protein
MFSAACAARASCRNSSVVMMFSMRPSVLGFVRATANLRRPVNLRGWPEGRGTRLNVVALHSLCGIGHRWQPRAPAAAVKLTDRHIQGVPPPMAFCIHCGHECAPSHCFCAGCGAAIRIGDNATSSADTDTAVVSSSPDDRKSIALVLLVTGLASCVVLAFVGQRAAVTTAIPPYEHKAVVAVPGRSHRPDPNEIVEQYLREKGQPSAAPSELPDPNDVMCESLMDKALRGVLSAHDSILVKCAAPLVEVHIKRRGAHTTTPLHEIQRFAEREMQFILKRHRWEQRYSEVRVFPL